MDKLQEARNIINETDKEMARLFCKRMEAVKQVAEYKKEHGLEIFDPVRESAVIARNSEAIEDSTFQEYYVNFIRNTMAISRSYQRRLLTGMRVAYSGTKGAFAYLAAKKLFPTAQLIPFMSFEDAYKAVEDGGCDSVVLPIENSSNGEVGQVTDLLFSGSLSVNAALELGVTHDLLGTQDATIDDITEVVSHPQALGQCAPYIKSHGFITRDYVNTALAAEYVAEKNCKNLAAIASADAAEMFGLKVLERDINQTKTNTTRFVVCSRKRNTDITSEKGTRSILIFTVRNEAGALAKAIEVIGSHGFNMLTLRSRPMKELLWKYYFYIETEGSMYTQKGREMLSELSELCDKMKIVGTYKHNQEVQ